MDRTASSSADDVTMDTIVTIYDSLIKDLEGAVQEDSGWASRDYDIADSLYDALLDLAHWMDSVALIANVENPSKNSTTRRSDIVSKFFNQLGENESFLSGTIRFYLREALQNLQALELAFVNGLVNSSVSSQNVWEASFSTSIQCLGLQLVPLRAWACSRQEVSEPESSVSEVVDSSRLKINQTIQGSLSLSRGPASRGAARVGTRVGTGAPRGRRFVNDDRFREPRLGSERPRRKRKTEIERMELEEEEEARQGLAVDIISSQEVSSMSGAEYREQKEKLLVERPNSIQQ